MYPSGEINGKNPSAKLLSDLLSSELPGAIISLMVSHRDITNTIEIVPRKKSFINFDITSLPDASPEEKALLDNWLKKQMIKKNENLR